MWKAENRLHGISPGSDSRIVKATAPQERPQKNIIVLVALMMACLAVEHMTSAWMPSASTGDGAEGFSVANTRKYLLDLTAIGPRVTGTKSNEVTTVNFLENNLLAIKAAAAEGAVVEVEVQRESSHFYFDFLGGYTNTYKNITNVVARVSWPDKKTALDDKAIGTTLINAHFDTVQGSPGGADDGLGVACMLEIAREIATGPPLKKPVVFLFNGAEEVIQLGAHAYITRHRWAPSTRYLINLESMGSGGKELVFQCNSGWLADFYGRTVPYPHGNVVAHEVFGNLLWRVAATDWSTLLRFGPPNVVGIDTAYVENGYAYHTTRDTPDIITDGSILHTGKNLLSLVKGLSLNAEEPSPNSVGFVFFDILGLWYVAYRGLSVVFLHSLVAAAGFAMIFKLTKTSVPVGRSTFAFWYSLLAGEVYCLAVTVFTCLITSGLAWLLCPMRFYDGGILVAYATYIPPTLVSAYFARGVVATRTHSSFDIRVLSSLLFWTPLLAFCVLCGIQSGYLCAMWVGGTVCAYLARQVTSAIRIGRNEGMKGMGTYAYEIFLLLAMCMWWNVVHTLLQIVLPLLGRVGTVVPGDFVVGLLVAFVLAMPCGVLLADTNCQPPTLAQLRASVAAILLLLFTLALTSSSYSSDRPKRLWLHHVHRDMGSPDGTSKMDHGLLVTAMDGRGMYPFLPSLGAGAKADVPSVMNSNNRMVNYCNSWNGDCYFQFPWLYPVADAMRDSFYIPTQKSPAFPDSARLSMALSTSTQELPLRRIAISLRGPPRMTLIVRDNAAGKRIKGWDIDINRKGRDFRFVKPSPVRPEGIHYIQVEFGLCPNDICVGEIYLQVQGISPVQIAAYGYYMSLVDDATQSLLTSLPDWAKRAEWSSCPSAFISRFI